MSPVRRSLLGVATLFLINGIALGSWLPRLPEIRDRLDVDLAAIGLALAFGGGGGLVGSSVSGWMVARIGSRRAALLPALGLVTVLPLIAIVPNVAALALVVATAGFLDAVADVGMNALGVRVEEEAGRSIMNRLHGVWSVGSLTGSAVSAGAVLAGVPLGWQLVVTTILGLGALILVRSLLPRPTVRPRPIRRPWAALSFAVAGGSAALIEGMPLDWSALFLTDVMGVGPGRAGVAFVLFTAGMVGGRMAGDLVVDRLGVARAIAGGLGLAAVGTALVILSPSLFSSSLATFLGFGLWGLGVSIVLPMLYKSAGSHPSFAEGAGLGALTLGSRIGFITGSAGVGAAAASWGLPGGILTMAAVAAIGVGFALPPVLRADPAVSSTH